MLCDSRHEFGCRRVGFDLLRHRGSRNQTIISLSRPYGYRDVAHRIRHQYAALGASSRFELVEDLTPHGYTPKLRRAIFTWFNTHLKNDPTPVTPERVTAAMHA